MLRDYILMKLFVLSLTICFAEFVPNIIVWLSAFPARDEINYICRRACTFSLILKLVFKNEFNSITLEVRNNANSET